MPTAPPLKPNDAAHVIAHLTGRDTSWVEQTARLLREDGKDMWPSPGRGTRNATVSARHLANLLMAASAPGAAPYTAVRTVRWISSLKRSGISEDIIKNAARDGAAATLAHVVETASDFGEFLAGIIDALADGMRPGADVRLPSFAALLDRIGFEICLKADASGCFCASVLINADPTVRGARELVSYADVGPKASNQGGGGILYWYYDHLRRAKYATFLPAGVLTSLAAAFARGRPNLAYLTAVELEAAISQRAPV